MRIARPIAIMGITLFVATSVGLASENLLKDPGFERYPLDKERGCYVPADNAAWSEYGAGGSSVVFDASGWKAPDEMTRSRPLGFTPGTKGHVGLGPEVNSGLLYFQQNVILPDDAGGKHYEAWVWLGGAGRDDDQGSDRKEERGGWQIEFFGSDDPANWKEPLERPHHAMHDFHGKRESFVRVSGFGRIPTGARGFRMHVSASIWSTAQAKAYDTQVALDNAHFAILEHPNLLSNGDFEEDSEPTQFVGWDRPAKYDFEFSTLKPIDVNDAYNPMNNWDHNFDHGFLLPFNGRKFAYGYTTYMCGWQKDGFTFSQDVRYRAPDGTPLTLMCYWIQNTPNMHHALQFREGKGSHLAFVVQYFDGRRELKTETLEPAWPIAAHPKNRCGKDQNPWLAYNPRFRLVPPDDTDRIRVNVRLMLDLEYEEGLAHVACAVDEFYLGLADTPK